MSADWTTWGSRLLSGGVCQPGAAVRDARGFDCWVGTWYGTDPANGQSCDITFKAGPPQAVYRVNGQEVINVVSNTPDPSVNFNLTLNERGKYAQGTLNIGDGNRFYDFYPWLYYNFSAGIKDEAHFNIGYVTSDNVHVMTKCNVNSYAPLP